MRRYGRSTKVMVNGPARKGGRIREIRTLCPCNDWHKLFSAEEPGRLEWVRQGCTNGRGSGIECKAAMAENLIKWIRAGARTKSEVREESEAGVGNLDAGSKKARAVAQGTMGAGEGSGFWLGEKRKEIADGESTRPAASKLPAADCLSTQSSQRAQKKEKEPFKVRPLQKRNEWRPAGNKMTGRTGNARPRSEWREPRRKPATNTDTDV